MGWVLCLGPAVLAEVLRLSGWWHRDGHRILLGIMVTKQEQLLQIKDGFCGRCLKNREGVQGAGVGSCL